ncbi:MAG: hypothetical protein CMB80_27710 [Flammeovirgaceae bacterium]|nr:hypothetical protein [Flammeovirgaceae bacterium]
MSNLVNISIDDVSPHPRSSVKVLDRCFELIKIFPTIKFSLFVPTSYWRTVRKEVATSKPLQIDHFPDFCRCLRELPKENFEICYHGHFHGIPGKNDNDELNEISYSRATELITAMKEVVKRADLEDQFKPIIRPPAWRMSPDAIRAFRDVGFEILALCKEDYAVATYQKEDEKKNDIVYASSYPPIKPLELLSKTEIVYHACDWDRNHLSTDQMKQLISFLEKSIEQIDFVFIKGLL